MAALTPLFMQIVVPAAFTVLASLVTWGGARLITYIDAHTKNVQIAGILSRLTSAVQTVVLDVNGTVRADVVAASADGKITSDEAAKIKAHALARVKEHLGVRGLAELTSILGIAPTTIDSFLGSHLEAALEGSKAPPSTSDQLLSALPAILSTIAPKVGSSVDPHVSSTGDAVPPAVPPATPAVAPVPK